MTPSTERILIIAVADFSPVNGGGMLYQAIRYSHHRADIRLEPEAYQPVLADSRTDGCGHVPPPGAGGRNPRLFPSRCHRKAVR